MAERDASLPSYRRPRWAGAAFWLLALIALAAVARRLAALIAGTNGGRSPMGDLDASFSSHAALTAMHIVPAAIFVVLAAWVLARGSGGAALWRAFFLFGAMTGLTAYAMSRYAIGGWMERSAVLVFNTWYLASLGRAWMLWRRGDAALSREWTIRAVGVLLGIATTRPVMALFFAASSRTHWRPEDFFGIAFWIGFSINVVAVEVWMGSADKRR
jgi:hypothetical protein